MTYYINPIWFYLMNVGCTLHYILMFGFGIILILSILIFIAWVTGNVDYYDMDDDEKKVLNSFKKFVVVCIISIFIGILIPSKETCIEMMIASQVTHENVQTTKEEIYEIIDYVTEKVKGE